MRPWRTRPVDCEYYRRGAGRHRFFCGCVRSGANASTSLPRRDLPNAPQRSSTMRCYSRIQPAARRSNVSFPQLFNSSPTLGRIRPGSAFVAVSIYRSSDQIVTVVMVVVRWLRSLLCPDVRGASAGSRTKRLLELSNHSIPAEIRLLARTPSARWRSVPRNSN